MASKSDLAEISYTILSDSFNCNSWYWDIVAGCSFLEKNLILDLFRCTLLSPNNLNDAIEGGMITALTHFSNVDEELMEKITTIITEIYTHDNTFFKASLF